MLNEYPPENQDLLNRGLLADTVFAFWPKRTRVMWSNEGRSGR